MVNTPLNPLSLQGNFYVVNNTNGQIVPGTITVSADGLTATYTPATALSANTKYYVRMYNATDLAGNTASGFLTYFTTGL